MATVTETVREVALFAAREPRSSFWFFLREVAQLNDAVTVKPYSVMRELAYLNDSTTQQASLTEREVAVLNDRAAGTARAVRTLREVARVLDSSAGGVRVTHAVREVAQLNDLAAGSAAVGFRDTARLLSRAVGTVGIARTIREVAQLGDSARSAPTGLVREVAQLNDAAPRSVRYRLNVRETAQLNDAARPVFRSANVLREVARLNDAYQTKTTTASNVLREVAYVVDTPAPPAYGRAYTCSVITWGMSTFSNYAFLTMAGQYAAGQNLWKLTGTQDNTTNISWYVKTPILDMSASQFKRLTAVYVSGTASAPLTVWVTGDVGGNKVTYDYELSVRDQTDHRNNRALVGKGFRSRYVQIAIGATDVRAKLVTAEADVALSARRI